MARTTKLNRVFNRIELNYTNITNQIKSWLGTIYDKSSILFNASSPYGQILEVTKEFFLQNILYLKNAVRQLDIEQANSKRMISNIARISGHNPSRAISAKGTLKFKLKQGVPIDKYVSNGQVIIYDNTLIKNRTNGLFYSLKIGNFRNYFSLLPGCQFFINVVQGRYETQTFTGDGTIIQSFQVTVSNSAAIDNFDYKVTLNGINLQIKDHIYDMLENEYACYTRTGFNGGLDVYFGNGVNGIVPPIGSVIEVTYLLNNGLIGNILNNKLNDFIFIDDIYDDSGNAILVSQLFDIFIETDIKFASNGESVEYTKSVIPYVSRNFVLATPSQYIYHLKKLNMFSKVNAFNTLDMVNIDIDSDGSLDQININEMYLYLIPRITDYFSTDVNYFNVSLDAFYLDDTEKKRIINFLKIQGIISITSYIKILDPVKRFFIINVFIRRFQDVLEDNIRENVITKLSEFFATYSRYDRIIKSDIIAGLKIIDGIDSVNIEFVGKANEDYHRDGALLSSNQKSILNSTYATNTNSVNVSADNYRNIVVNTNQNNSYYQYDLTKDGTNSTNAQLLANAITVNGEPILDQKGINNTSIGDSTIVAYSDLSKYDPKKMVGIDPILGDIIIGYNELIILRGGWKNRNDIYFSEDPNTAIGFSSVNIIWKGVTER
jgi:hypothetical protein